jgi:hypothetical protein
MHEDRDISRLRQHIQNTLSPRFKKIILRPFSWKEAETHPLTVDLPPPMAPPSGLSQTTGTFS